MRYKMQTFSKTNLQIITQDVRDKIKKDKIKASKNWVKDNISNIKKGILQTAEKGNTNYTIDYSEYDFKNRLHTGCITYYSEHDSINRLHIDYIIAELKIYFSTLRIEKDNECMHRIHINWS